MSINLLNDRQFNDYLTDITYQGMSVPKQSNYQGEFESPDYVEQHRDEIIKGILNQYIKLRVRDYVMNLENEPAFVLIDKSREDLPDWTKKTFERGEVVYEFKGALMSSQLRDDITEVRDYLYDAAAQYVDKVVNNARKTNKKPKIRYDFLKTSNEFATFEKALAAAKHWHEIMAEETAKRNKAKDYLEKSLKDVKKIMDLPDGLIAYELTSPEALDFESDNMGHCVGRGSYDAGVADGSIKIYSIRDAKGEPHATLEVRGNKVHQIKGKANKALVRKYIPAALQFIQSENLDVVNDLDKINAIKQDGKLWDIYNLPRGFVVKGNLNLRAQGLKELPDLSAVIVEGFFNCADNELINLKGAPKEVGEGFYCQQNKLISLIGAPKTVGGHFSCYKNQLTSLEGGPEKVGGNFACNNNLLTSLQYAPSEVSGDFECFDNELENLQGAPKKVGRSFICYKNRLTSLIGAPLEVGSNFECQYNYLMRLKYAPEKVGGSFDCSHNQLSRLDGAPKKIKGDFKCSYNQLISLVGGPEEVSGLFDCADCRLDNLKGVPSSQMRCFNCSHNFLDNLDDAPKLVSEKFVCVGNRITSLKGMADCKCVYFDCSGNLLRNLDGSPQEVEYFICKDNNLTSLTGGPKKVLFLFDCSKNHLKDLKGAPEYVGTDFNCADNKLVSLFGAPKNVGGWLQVGYLPNAEKIIAPEYIKDIKSTISPELLEVMIQNGKNPPEIDNTNKFRAGIEKLKNLFKDSHLYTRPDDGRE